LFELPHYLLTVTRLSVAKASVLVGDSTGGFDALDDGGVGSSGCAMAVAEPAHDQTLVARADGAVQCAQSASAQPVSTTRPGGGLESVLVALLRSDEPG
jgi:hypothetical protein